MVIRKLILVLRLVAGKDSCPTGVAFGQSPFTYLDFTDDVSLLAALLNCLNFLFLHWIQWQVRQHL